jgi:hypothetical protein
MTEASRFPSFEILFDLCGVANVLGVSKAIY